MLTTRAGGRVGWGEDDSVEVYTVGLEWDTVCVQWDTVTEYQVVPVHHTCVMYRYVCDVPVLPDIQSPHPTEPTVCH